MCLGVPGRIVRIWKRADGAPMAQADFVGVSREVCLAYLPDLAVGDHVIVHMGFALTRVAESAAHETIETMREYGVLAAPAPGPSEAT
jgi:hydrogenase expression/formation protein HypC